MSSAVGATLRDLMSNLRAATIFLAILLLTALAAAELLALLPA